MVLPTSTFILGRTPQADLLVNHPILDGRGLQIRSGKFPPQEDCPEGLTIGRKGRTLAGESLAIDLWSLPLAPVALALCLFLVVPFHPFGSGAGFTPPTLQDWTPVPLPAIDPLGNCAVDRSHPEGVRYSFLQPQGPGFQVAFFLGGVDRGEVRLRIDGNPLAGPFPLPRGWGEERFVPLPPGGKGGERTLEFLLPLNDGKPPSWSVRGVRVIPSAHRNPYLPVGQPPGPGREPEDLRRGPELAHRYRALQGSGGDEEKQVAAEMACALASDLVRLRSLAAAGRNEEAEKLRAAIRAWVPASWAEGQRLLHDRGGL